MRLRLTAIRIDPCLLLAGVLGLMALGIGLDAAVSRRRLALAEARQIYVSALTDTRTQLAGLARKVLTDRALAQNLSWKLEHSVRSTLEAKLQKGGLDQVELRDTACKVIASAGREGGAASRPCPFNAGKAPRSDTFFWTDAGGKPALGLIGRVGELRALDAAAADVFAVSYVQIDDNWLALQPELKRKMHALGLTIGPTHRAVVATEGQSDGDRAVASLGTNELFDAFLVRESLAANDGHSSRAFLWPLLALAFALNGATWMRARARRHNEARLIGQLEDWCRQLGKGAPSAANDRTPLAGAKALIEQALLSRVETAHALATQKQALEAELKNREDLLRRSKQRMGDVAELDSLAVQLSRTSGVFLERMSALHGRSEDLSDVLGGPLAEQSKHLFNMLMEWQEGVAERGARKFLRSLSETEGRAPGQSQLDEQLIGMAMLAGEICDLAVNASLEAHKLVETAAFAAQIAGYWRGIAARAGDEPPCETLAEALDDAHALVKLDPAFTQLHFACKLGSADAALLPAVPKAVWVTALYHVHLALADVLGQAQATIVTRLRRDQDRLLLVVQIAGYDANTSGKLPQRAIKQPYHLELARSVLAPFDVGLAALPALDGPFPIALTWTVAAATAAKAAKKPATKLLPQSGATSRAIQAPRA